MLQEGKKWKCGICTTCHCVQGQVITVPTQNCTDAKECNVEGAQWDCDTCTTCHCSQGQIITVPTPNCQQTRECAVDGQEWDCGNCTTCYCYNGHKLTIPTLNCSMECPVDGVKWDCGNCTTCRCIKGQIIKVPQECPDVTDCPLDTHKLKYPKDSCCLKCVPKNCELRVDPPVNITVNNCTSTKAVQMQLCRGDCPTGHIVDYVTGTMVKRCSCCSAVVDQYKNIDLMCPNGQIVKHSIPIVKSCECDKCSLADL